MAWTAPRTYVSVEIITASILNTDVRDNFLQTGPALIGAVSQYLVSTAANALVARTVSQASVLTSETTTSTTYTNLATSGPAVTVTTGTQAFLFFTARMNNDTSGSGCFVSYGIPGASSASGSDARALEYDSSVAADNMQAGFPILHGGLTAGSNTFTLKYRASANTATFSQRRLQVLPF